jgi:hypothetical protein
MATFDIDALSHVLGVNKDELSTSLKKEGEDSFLEGDELVNAARSFIDSKVIKSKLDVREKQVLGRAKKEALTEFEKQIIEKFDIKEKKQGIDLVDYLFELGKQEAIKGGIAPEKIAELDEKDLFKLPAVQKILNSHVKERDVKIKALEDETSKVKTEYDSFKQQIETRETQSKIDAALISELEKLGVQFSDDTKKKQLQIKQFLLSVKQSEKFGFDEKGNPLPIGEDGNQLYRDSKYQTIADIVNEYNVLPKLTVDPKISSHSPNNAGQNGQKTVKKFTLPASAVNDKTGNEFWKLYEAEKDKELKAAMLEAFKAL